MIQSKDKQWQTGNDMKVEIAILISDKTDFKTKPIKTKKCTI